MNLEYIKCHGSGNEFVMIDAVGASWAGTVYGDTLPREGVDIALLARKACDRQSGIGADGLLLTVRNKEGMYGMRMLNPDGSEAEMCGNGIRCVARQTAERHITEGDFTLYSGRGLYPIRRSDTMAEGVEAYGVKIAVSLQSDALPMTAGGAFVGQKIEALADGMLFTAISVGNPHVIAKVECIDYALLEELGERIKKLNDVFPQGVNLSFVEVRGRDRIFVATYERGAGITSSCGTAMTSSATAMTLLGECDRDTEITVANRGGAVRCICRKEADGALHTTLTGNASYMSAGRIDICGDDFTFSTDHIYEEEARAYEAFRKRING